MEGSKGTSCPRIHIVAEIKEVGIASAVPIKAQSASVSSKKTPKTQDVLVTSNEALVTEAKAAEATSTSVPVSYIAFRILKRL